MRSLSDIMSAMRLTFWPEVALVVFFVAFVAIVIYVFSRRKGYWERERRLPLDDDHRRDRDRGED